MSQRSLHLVITVPKIGDITLQAKGDIPRAGFLGPITQRICDLKLPPGIYDVRVIAEGGRSFNARPELGARRQEAENKLREIVRDATELVERLSRTREAQVIEFPN